VYPHSGHIVAIRVLTQSRNHRLTSGGKAVPLLELWNQMGNIDEEAIPQKGKHDAS